MNMKEERQGKLRGLNGKIPASLPDRTAGIQCTKMRLRTMDDIRLIDADATKEKLGFAIELLIGSTADEIRNDTLLKAIAIVDSMPTVDAQPVKHGRWIPFMPDCRGYTEEFECSLCKNMTYLHYCEKDCDYEHCPNCGAKMD